MRCISRRRMRLRRARFDDQLGRDAWCTLSLRSRSSTQFVHALGREGPSELCGQVGRPALGQRLRRGDGLATNGILVGHDRDALGGGRVVGERGSVKRWKGGGVGRRPRNCSQPSQPLRLKIGAPPLRCLRFRRLDALFLSHACRRPGGRPVAVAAPTPCVEMCRGVCRGSTRGWARRIVMRRPPERRSVEQRAVHDEPRNLH